MSDILVKPPQLRSGAEALRASAKTIQVCIDAIDAEIKALGPSRFEGVSAEEFRQRYSRLRERVYSFRPTIDSFANELESAAARFEQADKSL